MKLRNLTPHPICLTGEDGVTTILDRDGPPVRLATRPGPRIGTFGGWLPIHACPTVIGVVNLPPRIEGTIIIVSQIAAMACAELNPERDDVVFPGTAPGDEPTFENNRISGVTRLIRAS